MAAFVDGNANHVTEAMILALRRHGVEGFTKVLCVDEHGAQIER